MSTSPITSSLASTLASTLAAQSVSTGSSSFDSDLQAAVTRAVAIASLPMQLVQADETTVSNEATELGTLSSLFSNVQSSIESLASDASGSSLATSVSDPSVIQASLTGSALPGTYTIDVTDPGSSASVISNPPATAITDPTSQNLDSSGNYTLTVGSQTYNISASTLNGLASAINSSGAPVQAVVVNLGAPSSPSYNLVIQSNTLGSTTLQLTDQGSSTDLVQTLNGGDSATYTVNGQPPNGITTNSSTVTVAPGLNVNIEQEGSSTVTVSASLSNISNDLSSFVNAYNAAVAELNNNHGQDGAALTGNSIVLSLQQSLNQIAAYTGGSGSITNLTQLGATFTAQGTLSFDPSVIAGLSQSQITDALSFLGGATTGGFLQYATSTIDSVTDPTNGIIASESQALQTEGQNDQNQINNDQTQVTALQASLQQQMANSDALIATLQQQNTFMQGLFQYETSNNPDASSAG